MVNEDEYVNASAVSELMAYDFNSFGVDPSTKLLELGREKYGNQNIDLGRGEELPYEKLFFKGVMAECTMSLMEDFKKTINESYRVLQDQGYFIISDVYARKPEYLEELKKHNVNSCLSTTCAYTARAVRCFNIIGG